MMEPGEFTAIEPMGIVVPTHLLVGVLEYALEGQLPGGFLTAVLSNDLANAVGRADPTSTLALKPLLVMLHNGIPAPAWGSPAKVKEWAEAGGWFGKHEEAVISTELRQLVKAAGNSYRWPS